MEGIHASQLDYDFFRYILDKIEKPLPSSDIWMLVHKFNEYHHIILREQFERM